jgi:hypothetical protein
VGDTYPLPVFLCGETDGMLDRQQRQGFERTELVRGRFALVENTVNVNIIAAIRISSLL